MNSDEAAVKYVTIGNEADVELVEFRNTITEEATQSSEEKKLDLIQEESLFDLTDTSELTSQHQDILKHLNLTNANDDVSKKIRAYYEHFVKKPMRFNGYRDLVDDEEEQDDEEAEGENVEQESNELGEEKVSKKMTEKTKKEILECVINGDIVSLNELLRTPGADINMTHFSENLLMIAMRHKQIKIAEYLIANGIDVLFETKLYEFKNNKPPISYYMYSCRQMAYDLNYTNLVDLIDIFNDKTNAKIRKVLSKRYLKNNVMHSSSKEYIKLPNSFDVDNELNEADKITYLLSDDANLLQLEHQTEDDEMFNQLNDENNNLLENDLTNKRTIINNLQPSTETISQSSLSYISNASSSRNGYFLPRKHNRIKNVTKEVIQKLHQDEEENSRQKNDFLSVNKKSLEYRGYKLNLLFDEPASKTAAKTMRNKSAIRNFTPTNQVHNQMSTTSRPTTQSSLRFNSTVTPLTFASFKNENNYYAKLNGNEKVSATKSTVLNNKELCKLNNRNYLNTLSKRTAAKEVINECINKYTEPLFPLGSPSKSSIKSDKSLTNVPPRPKTSNKVSFGTSATNSRQMKPTFREKSFHLTTPPTSSSSLFRGGADSIKSIAVPSTPSTMVNKTREQIYNSYLSSLKSSGLVNAHCLPILKSNKPKEVASNAQKHKNLAQKFNLIRIF